MASGAVVFIGEGKGTDALSPFGKSLRCSGAKIQAVATDMSAAYTLVVSENLKDVIHVFDRFHVVKLFNDKLADLRREVQRSTEKIEHKELLKGTYGFCSRTWRIWTPSEMSRDDLRRPYGSTSHWPPRTT